MIADYRWVRCGPLSYEATVHRFATQWWRMAGGLGCRSTLLNIHDILRFRFRKNILGQEARIDEEFKPDRLRARTRKARPSFMADRPQRAKAKEPAWPFIAPMSVSLGSASSKP